MEILVAFSYGRVKPSDDRQFIKGALVALFFVQEAIMQTSSYPSPANPQISLPCISILGHPPSFGNVAQTSVGSDVSEYFNSHDMLIVPAVILTGLDDSGKPHASRFTKEQRVAAETAAILMNMAVIEVDTEELAAIASSLPQGKLFESGKAFVPFVKRETYERLEAHLDDDFLSATSARVTEAAGAATYAAASKGEATARLPEDWSKLAVGDRVLASDGPGDGWYEAHVRELLPDGKFWLQWRDWPEIDQFTRTVTDIALLHPKHAGA